MAQKANLLKPNYYNNKFLEHEDAMMFRLSLPLMAKIFDLNPHGIFILLNIFNVFLLLLFLFLIHKHTKDKRVAFLFTLGVASTYLGCCGFLDVQAGSVIIMYTFLLLAICFRNPIIILFCVLTAAWSDERALLGSTLVYYWWIVIDNKFTFKSLLTKRLFNLSSISVVVAWAIYFLGRAYLVHAYGFRNSLINQQGIYILFDVYNNLQLSLWSTFEGLWLLVLCLMVALIAKKDWVNALFITGGLLFLFLAGVSNHDTTKSHLCMFLLLPIAVIYLHENLLASDLRKLICISSMVCILSPTVYIIKKVIYASPIFQEGLLYIKVHNYEYIYPEEIKKMHRKLYH
ncbi:MAG: hypothetical protein SFW35_14110 [Chitinophagales bacterium]|nr:hypothetical protein [Chitinophagales bacterium]